MTTCEDLEPLLARCALHDRSAFEALYHKTSAQLFGVVLRIVNDRELAGEVLQESYIKIWHHAGEFRADKARPQTWMISIARNQAIDFLRRQATRPQSTEPVDELYWLADETAGPEEIVDAQQQEQALHRCLEQFEGEQRRVLQLAYFHGMTHEELAKRMEKPLGTVKSWLRRGLLRLKNCLDKI